MDLGSIREDLLGGNYNTVQDFNKDMMLIFSNSKQYNTERSAVSVIFKQILKFFINVFEKCLSTIYLYIVLIRSTQ